MKTNAIEAQPSLGRTAVRGAGSMLTGQLLRMALQLLSVVILSRLLSPRDYGLVAMVMVVIAFGEVFRDFGLSQAAVRAPTLSRSQRDALFLVNTAIGAGFAALLFVLAPQVAAWFDHPELVPMARVLAVVFVFNGLVAQYRADLTRSMRFRALVVSDLGAQAVGLILATGLALWGFGFWALVAQQVTIGLVGLVLAAAYCGWLPRWPQKGTRIGDMLRFGFGLVASQIVGYLSTNMDNLVIGTQLGATDLGYYNRAYQLLTRSVNQLRAPSTSVAVPILTRLEADPRRADDFIVKGQAALGYTLMPGLAFIAAAAAPIVGIVLGDGWAQAIPVLTWLAVAAMFETTSYFCYWVYLVRGLTGKFFWFSLVSMLIKVVCVLIGSHGGVVGVAAGIAVAGALSWPLSIGWLSMLTRVPTRRIYLSAAWVTLLAGLVAGGALAGLALVPTAADLIRLPVALAGAGLGYGLTLALVPPAREAFGSLVASVRHAGWFAARDGRGRRPGRAAPGRTPPGAE